MRRLPVAGLPAVVLLGLPICAIAHPASEATAVTAIAELVVTAERREETLQNTPLAVSAFTAEARGLQRIEAGPNLVQAVPNMNFSRSNFGGFNVVIRGIGTKATGNSGEPGVSFHVNNSPLSANRFADSEFYDVERIEVLRGPQGTLYGRNATGGVINILTARPARDFSGYLTAEYGNFDTQRLKGAVNLPLNEMMAIRWAGFYLKRDGFGTNTVTGSDIDSRDIGASRLSFRIKPSDAFDAVVMWEHFNEKDSRSRIGKQLCVTDPGPTTLGGVPVSASNRGLLSQGCLPGSRYGDTAFGVVNSVPTISGMLAQISGLAPAGDLNAGAVQDRDLRNIQSVRDPIYQGQQDFLQIDIRARLTDALTLTSLTSFNYNEGYSYQDYNRVQTARAFAPIGAAALLFPGGFVNDPQVGRSNLLRQFDMTTTDSKEFTQEIRLASEFAGPLNISAGALHINYQADANYYVFSNGLTAYAQLNNAAAAGRGVVPFFVDPGFPPSGEGHNYFDSRTDVAIRSDAVFGELYWKVAETLKFTGGLRYTRDHKHNHYLPITLLQNPTRVAMPPASGLIANPAFNDGRGFPPVAHMEKRADAVTGRLNLQWSPDVHELGHAMVYANYARGYKGGGFNTPCDIQTPGCGLAAATFQPERVDAVEIGARTLLADGRLILNATAFAYDYDGYQITKIINKGAQIDNVDATVRGLELESVWEPVDALRFNLNLGFLRSRITGGSAIDSLDRTQGDPRLAVIKAQDASNCVVNRAALAQLLAINQGLPGAPNIPGITGSSTALLGACSGQFAGLGLYNYAGTEVMTAPTFVNGAPGPNTTVQVGQGVPVGLKDNRLPNAPSWTLSAGLQYGWTLSGGWRATVRGDYYRQAHSYTRIFNTVSDRLRGYQNVNATLTFIQRDLGLELQLYGRNLTNAAPITDLYLGDDSSGLFANAFTLDPRQYGVSFTKRF